MGFPLSLLSNKLKSSISHSTLVSMIRAMVPLKQTVNKNNIESWNTIPQISLYKISLEPQFFFISLSIHRHFAVLYLRLRN